MLASVRCVIVSIQPLACLVPIPSNMQAIYAEDQLKRHLIASGHGISGQGVWPGW